jgi:hypothetical protein
LNAQEWNDKYPVGTECFYFPIRDGGKDGKRYIFKGQDYIKTRTRSIAWDIEQSGYRNKKKTETLVMVVGRSGGVDIRHCLFKLPKDAKEIGTF